MSEKNRGSLCFAKEKELSCKNNRYAVVLVADVDMNKDG